MKERFNFKDKAPARKVFEMPKKFLSGKEQRRLRRKKD